MHGDDAVALVNSVAGRSHTFSFVFTAESRSRWKMNWVKNIIFVLLSIAFCADCEWIEIPQSAEQTSERKLSIDNSMVASNGFIVKDLNELKYEELADIIGPGFEDEFSKFLSKHSHEMNASADDDVGVNQTIKQNLFYVDPWLKYDQGHTTAPFITSQHVWIDSKHKNTAANHRNRSATTSNAIASSITLRQNMTTTTTSKSHTTVNQMPHVTNKATAAQAVPNANKKQPAAASTTTKMSNSSNKPIPKRKTNQIKWIPYNPFSFNEILNFLRSIQHTFSIDTARGVTAKIEILKKFKAELLHNIGKIIIEHRATDDLQLF